MQTYLDWPRLLSVGTFATYYDYPTGVGNSKARCCSVLPTDTSLTDRDIDYRGRWDWYMRPSSASTPRPFQVMTIDRPDVMIRYLEQVGLRDTTPILSGLPSGVGQ
jgi:hypothetical protein